MRPGVQHYMSSFLNFLVVAILIFDRSLVRLVVQSWHLEFFARLFDLCSVWWCDLDILKFLLCPFIWSLFHLVVRSWHLELLPVYYLILILYFIIRTTGVRSSCDLDNILKSEWDRDYRSSCGLNILNYELIGSFSGCDLDIMNFFGPFSGWLRSWYFEPFGTFIFFFTNTEGLRQ